MTVPLAKKRTVRLIDVAKAAGVSRGTASNAFNRPELVRREVLERVEAAARALGFGGPDRRGRLLRAGKVNAIGVVMGGAGGVGHWFRLGYGRDFMTGVAEVCDQFGVSVTLVSSGARGGVGGIKDAFVDGFILHRVEEVELTESAKHRRLPFVMMDVDANPDFSSVDVDYRGGARLAVRHLLDLGHRRFAILSVLRASGHPPIFHRPGESHRQLVSGVTPDRERLAGFAEALADAGISIDDVPIVEAFFAGEAATAGIAMLLDMAPEATAVVSMADSQALAVLDEARRRGLVVPRDLSVVGFDDIAEAAHSSPPLTTIAQPILEKGRAAARILLEGGPPRHVVLPVKLIVRGSTAPPRG